MNESPFDLELSTRLYNKEGGKWLEGRQEAKRKKRKRKERERRRLVALESNARRERERRVATRLQDDATLTSTCDRGRTPIGAIQYGYSMVWYGWSVVSSQWSVSASWISASSANQRRECPSEVQYVLPRIDFDVSPSNKYRPSIHVCLAMCPSMHHRPSRHPQRSSSQLPP